MPADVCPTRDELLKFVLATLPEDRSETVSFHLESCLACETVVDELQHASDSIIRSVRENHRSARYVEEPACQQALSRIAAITRPSSSLDFGVTRPTSADDRDLGNLRDYKLLAQIGAGGMGTVYKAFHIQLKRIVAVKILSADRMRDERAVARFQREMEAVGRLRQHPNLVLATDAGEVDGTHFLAMEYVEGIDLSTLAHRLGPLPVTEACELVRQAAVGLQAAHEAGLVHRDIKPSNLMLTFSECEGTVKVLDLGLARVQNEAVDEPEFTHSGQVFGTTDYMSPEQAQASRDIDIRADIYSLGCTLYRLLAGRAPYTGPDYDTPLKKLLGHGRDPLPPIRTARPDVPNGLVAVLDRCLAKSPAARYDTPAELAAALVPLANGARLRSLLPEDEHAAAASEASAPSQSAQCSTDAYRSSALSDTSSGRVPHAPSARMSAAPAASPPRHRVSSAAGGGFLNRVIRSRVGWTTAIALALGGSALFVWMVVIRVHHNDGQTTVVKVPEGSQVAVGPTGEVDVSLPRSQPDVPVPTGREIRVSQATAVAPWAATPTSAAVTWPPDRGFRFVWESGEKDAQRGGIFTRRFNADGSPSGDQQRIAAGGTSACLASDAEGNFTVAWTPRNPPDGRWDDIHMRRFKADGTPRSPAVRVNVTDGRAERDPAVAMTPDGRCVIVWLSITTTNEVRARCFDARGAPATGEITVSDDIGTQAPPRVAMDREGGFVVTWHGSGAGDVSGVFARRFEKTGVPRGEPFRLNTTVAGKQFQPSPAMAADGRFAAVWESEDQDGEGFGIVGRTFDRTGDGGSEFQVNTTGKGQQRRPAIAMDPRGNFVVAWSSDGQDGDRYGVYAQRFDAAAQRLGKEFRVNETTKGSQSGAAVAIRDSESFVVAFCGAGPAGDDGVFARVFDGAAQATAATAPTAAFRTIYRDSLDDPRLFEEFWQIRRPVVQQADGVLVLRNRGALSTRREFPRGISLQFRWRWTQGAGTYSDVLTVALRSSGIPNPKWPFDIKDGVQVRIYPYGDGGGATIVDVNTETVLAKKDGLLVPKNQWHDVRVTDDGHQVALYVRDFDEPFLVAEVPAAARHHVAIHNREEVAAIVKESQLDDFVIGERGR